MSDFNSNYTDLVNFLPSPLSNELSRNIFRNLYNRFLTKKDSKYIAGIIGSDINTQYKQIVESSVFSQENQLQTVATTTIGTENYYLDFQSFLQKLSNLGVDISEFQKWGAAQTFNFAPPIDFDKLVNYQNYYWDTSIGGEDPDYITIKNKEIFSQTRLNIYLRNIFNAMPQNMLIASSTSNNGYVPNVGNFNTGTIVIIYNQDSNQYQYNRIVNSTYQTNLNNFKLTFEKELLNGINLIVSLDIPVSKLVNSNQLNLNGDYSSVLNENTVVLIKNLSTPSLTTILSTTVQNNITTVNISEPVDSALFLSISPYLSLLNDEYNYYYNNGISNYYTPYTESLIASPIINDNYGIFQSTYGFTNIKNPSVIFDNSYDFTSIGISVGFFLIVTSGPMAGKYEITSVGKNYIGLDTNVPFFNFENIEYTVIQYLPFDFITNSIQLFSPQNNEFWYNPQTNTLYQWVNNTWQPCVNNYSCLVELTNYKFREQNRITSNFWSSSNAWKNESDINDFSTAIRAQLPIIEFDDVLELSNLSYSTHSWQYSNGIDVFSDINESPILFEILNIQNTNSYNAFSFLNNNSIILNSDFGNVAYSIEAGTKIQILNGNINNGIYTVQNSTFEQISYNQKYQTVITLLETVPDVSSSLVGAVLAPVVTSVGDNWLGYNKHWAYFGINDINPSSANITVNPIISQYIKSIITNTYQSNLYTYRQDFVFTNYVAGTNIYFDPSLQNVVLFDDYQEGDVRVYINNIRQYGNFTDLRSEYLYDFMGGIQFNSSVLLTQNDILRIEVGPYAIQDIGRTSVPVLSYLNLQDPTNTNLQKFNLVNYRNIEQTRQTNNDKIYFKVYDINGNASNVASTIFDYESSQTSEVNPYLLRRISYNSETGDYGFIQNMSDPVTGEFYFYFKNNGSLTSIWKGGINGEKIIPQMLSDGTWDIPQYWSYNVQNELYQTFYLSQINKHFTTIIDSQSAQIINNTASNNYCINDNINYALGGTIKEFNGNIGLLVSAMNVNNTDPLTIIDFAKNIYLEQINFVKRNFFEIINAELVNSTLPTLEDFQQYLINQLISSFNNNEKYNKWFGDSTTNSSSLFNWIATPAYFGLVNPTIPYSMIDSNTGMYVVVSHINGQIDTSLNNTQTQQIYAALVKLGVPVQNISQGNAPFPANMSPSNGTLLIRKYNNSVSLFRFSSSNFWEEIDIASILTNCILTIEQNLYNNIPQYQALRYDFTKLQTFNNYYTNYEQRFLNYCSQNNIPSPFFNAAYSPTNAFTWNYLNAKVSIYPTSNTVNYNNSSYQSLYENYFGTAYPHLEPWKMQGYAQIPAWWNDEYLAPSTANRRWNQFMWTNILNGVVPAGNLLPDNVTNSTGIIEQLAGYNYIPVNWSNSPTLDNIQPDELIPPYWDSANSSVSTIRSLYDPQHGDFIPSSASNFYFGDGNQNEYFWKHSISYSYDLMYIAFLCDPIEFFSQSFGNTVTKINCLDISTDTQNVQSYSNIYFHGEFNNNNKITLINGLNQWYVNYNRYYGYDGPSSLFYDLWKKWNPQLAYIAGSLVIPDTLFLQNFNFDLSDKDYYLDILKNNSIINTSFDTFNLNVLNVPSLYSKTRDNGNEWEFQLSTSSGNPVNYYGVQNYPFYIGSDNQTLTISKYPILNANITIPYNYINIYFSSISENDETSYFSGRNYSATISIGGNAFTLQTTTSPPATVGDALEYVNQTINGYGYITIQGNNLVLISDNNQPISLSDLGFFNAMLNTYNNISGQFTAPYSFNNSFVVFGNKTLDFQNGNSFIVTNSTNFNGTYYIIGSTYDVTTNSTIIQVNPLTPIVLNNSIVDGDITYNNFVTLPPTWETGTEVYLTSTGVLPSPLLTLTPYYLIIIDNVSFQLAKNIKNATNGIAITLNNSGTGTPSVGSIVSTFTPLGGEQTNYSWFIYNTDTRIIKTLPSISVISSIQSLCNVIDGYQAYLENVSNIAIQNSSIDSVTGRINGWQLEKEKTINYVYQLNNYNQAINITYDITVDLPNSRFITSSSVQLLTGQVINLYANANSTLPAPFSNTFQQNLKYYVIASNDNAGFQVAATYGDAINGVFIPFESAGTGTFYCALVTTLKFPTLNLNPYKFEFWVNTPVGILNSVSDNSLYNIFKSYINDEYNRKISEKDFLVLRNNETNHILLTDSFVKANPYIYMSNFNGYVSTYQSLVVFNDYAVSGNLIYDSFFGLNTPNFYIECEEQSNEILRPSVGGYISINDALLPNMEGYTQSLRNMYDLYNGNIQDGFKSQVLNSLGYDGPYDFLNQLEINDKTQFLFYKGMIKNKGSNLSINAFSNQINYNNSSLDEYWAYKIATFGDNKPKNYPQLMVQKTDVTQRELRFEFVQPQAAPLYPTFTPIEFTDMSRWVDLPYLTNQFNGANTFYFGAKLSDVLYSAENLIFSIPQYGVKLIKLNKNSDGVIIYNYNTTTNQNEELIHGTDYTMYNNYTVLLYPTQPQYVNLTIYSINVNFEAHQPFNLIDTESTAIITDIPLIDPLNGRYNPYAYSIVDWHTSADVASYTNYANGNTPSEQPWFGENVGKIWFDSTTEVYYPYNDSSIITDINDRIFNWARLADFASINLYQWVESDVDPITYDTTANNGTSKKHVFLNTGTQTNPVWVEQKTIVLNYFGYELFSAQIPTTYGTLAIYLNGSFDINIDLTVNSPADYINRLINGQTSVPTPYDYISFVFIPPTPTVQQIQSGQYKVVADYSVKQVVNDKDGSSVNKYYFWAQNTTDTISRIDNQITNSVDAQTYMLNSGGPYAIISGLRYSNNGYGNIFGINFDEDVNNFPIRYTDLVIKGINGFITQNNRYALRITNDYTLRDRLPTKPSEMNYNSPGNSTPLSLKNVHTQWKLFRKKQLIKIDRILWDAITSSILGYAVVNGSITDIQLPSLEYQLYDSLNNTSYRYGLGAGQIFMDSEQAITIISTMLADPAITYTNIDIQNFLKNNNFNTPFSTLQLMNSIYETFDPINVNNLFFECLYDAMSLNLKNSHLLKTSWVAIDVNGVVNQTTASSNDSVINNLINGDCTQQLLPPLIKPSSIPFPSQTPVILLSPTPTPSPTQTITPSITISASASLVVSPTPTPSITNSVQPTPTLTPSITSSIPPTQTASITPSVTGTASPSSTPASTLTQTPSITPTNTPQPSQTPTNSPTISTSPSGSPQPSLTAAPTSTPTPTPTHTMTPTITITPSTTSTPVPTPSPTPSVTPSTSPPAISVSVSPTTASGSVIFSGSTFPAGGVKATSSSITVFPSGGTGSYTYEWVKVSGTLFWSATAPSSSTTAWEYSFTSHTTASSIWYCKVTDSAGNTANSQNISVTLSCTT